MSKLKADNVENLLGTKTTSMDNVIAGCAKAFVNFNGTGTVAIRDSHNVSSITDNGTGDYTINFTDAFDDADYSPAFSTQSGATTSSTRTVNILASSDSAATTAKTTTSMRVVVGATNAASLTDMATIVAIIFTN